MRRLVILALLFGLMYALPFLQVGSDTPFNPISLATFGFILLASYTLGEIVARLNLPKITGYIVTGLVFGPYVVNLFSVAVVDDLRIINGLAIGLIAFSAGGEMKVKSLRQMARSLALLVVVKGLLILGLVTAAVYFIRSWLPFLEGASVPLVLAVGGLIGVLAIGTSPSATIAVIGETGARGRLTDLTLGIAVFKDVVMVILMALFIALARVFAAPGAGFDPHVLVVVGEELLFSIGVGTLLGGATIFYLRFVRAEVWLYVIAAIFTMTYVAQAFHLEALLLFIVAGFVVQNFSKEGDDFVHQIESVALPVYVVFFTVAGAGLDLNALQEVGLVAGVLVLVRGVAIWLGSGLALRLAREEARVRQPAWMAFVSQAGVVIGLTIILANNLPGLGGEIRTVVLGMVAIHLIGGPVLFKLALSRAGEIGDGAAPAVAPPAEGPPLPEAEGPDEPAFAVPAFASPRLQREAEALRLRLQPLVHDFNEQFVTARTEGAQAFLDRVERQVEERLARLERDLARSQGAAVPDGVALPVRQVHATLSQLALLAEGLQREAVAYANRREHAEAGPAAFRALFDAVHQVAQQQERAFAVVREPERLAARPGDGPYVRARKALGRLAGRISRAFGSGVPPSRRVPLRRIVRYHLDGMLPTRLERVAARAAAFPVFALEKSRVVFHTLDAHLQALAEALEAGTPLDPAAAAEALRAAAAPELAQARADVARFGQEVQRRTALEVARAYGDVLADLEVAGTFELPARRRRFSAVHEASHDAREAAAQAFDAWARVAPRVAGYFVQLLELARVRVLVRRLVDRTLGDDAVQVLHAVQTSLEEARRALAEAGAALDAGENPFGALGQGLEQRLDAHAYAPLQQLRRSRLLTGLLDRVLEVFSDIVSHVPETYQVVDPSTLPAPGEGRVPAAVRPHEVLLRDATRIHLETRVARALADVNQGLLNEVQQAVQAVVEAQQIVRLSLEGAPDEGDADAARAEVAGGVARAQARLEQTQTQVAAFRGQLAQRVRASTSEVLATLVDEVAGGTAPSARTALATPVASGEAPAAATWSRLKEATRSLRDRLQHYVRPLARELLSDRRAGGALAELAPTEVMQRADQAFVDAERLTDLPFIYRKLFDLNPIETDELLAGRERERAALAAAVARWEEGHATTVALVGEAGTGLSSMIAAARRTLLERFAVATVQLPFGATGEAAVAALFAEALGLPSGARLADVEAALVGSPAAPAPRRVILLEGLHHTVERRPGGFGLARRLARLVSHTADRVLWIAPLSAPAHRYLDAAVRLGDAFLLTVRVGPLGRDDLERAMLARHRVSGLDLVFEPPALLRQRRRYRRAPAAEQQRLARRAFFDGLARLSGGHPATALFYWLKAIAEVREQALVLRVPARLQLGYLRHLDRALLLALRIVFEQGGITPPRLAYLLGLPEASATTLLEQLVRLHLLVRGAGGAFTLNRAVAAPVAAELRALHLLPPYDA